MFVQKMEQRVGRNQSVWYYVALVKKVLCIHVYVHDFCVIRGTSSTVDSEEVRGDERVEDTHRHLFLWVVVVVFRR